MVCILTYLMLMISKNSPDGCPLSATGLGGGLVACSFLFLGRTGMRASGSCTRIGTWLKSTSSSLSLFFGKMKKLTPEE
uniref:Uncharacterized protein n=1 Tax=Picea glauca TaxID=3330 RepID=A0A117NIY3_PICGL|nr:hypothetical protein ABT39_MTgene444 [Picea glauca]QHR88198.1 hypothetical protein Q903MT_gene2211 [Picea sitchensis]